MTDAARWIFDIGAHTGLDSEFYLRKGFNVVAVEAFPKHCEHLREKFAREIAEGRYVMEAVGVSGETGTGRFFVHPEKDDWHTRTPEEWRGTFIPIDVPFERFATICRRHPQPYYIKIDIEGAERHVLDDLTEDTRPRYLSIELNDDWPHNMKRLIELGYGEMIIVNQRTQIGRAAPSPSREGASVRTVFTGHHSGPFGEDLGPDWTPIRSVAEAGARIEALSFDKGDWYDIHVR